jgi:hypothetical protein
VVAHGIDSTAVYVLQTRPCAWRFHGLLVGDEARAIEAIEVAVETDAGIENRTVYLTHLGPVVAGPNTPWNDQHVYVMRDVNYENYRTGDQYAAMQRSTDVTQLRQALAIIRVQHLLIQSQPTKQAVLFMPICRRYQMCQSN